jgi:hypothetical protein
MRHAARGLLSGNQDPIPMKREPILIDVTPEEHQAIERKLKDLCLTFDEYVERLVLNDFMQAKTGQRPDLN